jgi:hypothetical protein
MYIDKNITIIMATLQKNGLILTKILVLLTLNISFLFVNNNIMIKS